MDDWTAVWLPDVGLGAALFLLMWAALQTGRLFTRREWMDKVRAYEQLLADKDTQIAQWREAFLTSDQRGDIQVEQMGDLVRTLRTTEQVTRALGDAATAGGPRDG